MLSPAAHPEKGALVKAVRDNDLDGVKILLAQGADVNEENGSALLYAASENRMDILRLLVEAGPDLESATVIGNTALIYAGINGHAEVARFLLEQGANPYARNKYDRTAESYVRENLHPDVVAVLREAPALRLRGLEEKKKREDRLAKKASLKAATVLQRDIPAEKPFRPKISFMSL